MNKNKIKKTANATVTKTADRQSSIPHDTRLRHKACRLLIFYNQNAAHVRLGKRAAHVTKRGRVVVQHNEWVEFAQVYRMRREMSMQQQANAYSLIQRLFSSPIHPNDTLSRC
jgi:hypothetical protein